MYVKRKEILHHTICWFLYREQTLLGIYRFSSAFLVRTECSECKNGNCPNISYQECDISKLPSHFIHCNVTNVGIEEINFQICYL